MVFFIKFLRELKINFRFLKFWKEHGQTPKYKTLKIPNSEKKYKQASITKGEGCSIKVKKLLTIHILVFSLGF